MTSVVSYNNSRNIIHNFKREKSYDYKMKRLKNNEAAKKSRAKRRTKATLVNPRFQKRHNIGYIK